MADYATSPVYDGMKGAQEAPISRSVRTMTEGDDIVAPPTVQEALDALENSLLKLRESEYSLADKLSPIMVDGPQPGIGETRDASSTTAASIVTRIYELRDIVDQTTSFNLTIRGRTSL